MSIQIKNIIAYDEEDTNEWIEVKGRKDGTVLGSKVMCPTIFHQSVYTLNHFGIVVCYTLNQKNSMLHYEKV